VTENMLCPFCLKENTITEVKEGGRSYYVCSEHAEPRIPVIYGENKNFPRDVISAVGFRGHGKTAYFASLFSSLDDLAKVWPNFYTFPIDEKGLDTVHDNIKMLKGGKLPTATPVNFPFPTIVQFSKMPRFKERFLIFYDTGGENFEKASRLVANANFVKRSQTAVFFLSLRDIDYNSQEMARLLAVYIMGLKEIGGDPKQQNLLVVLTKGDLLAPKLEKHNEIWDYLVNGDTKNLQYANLKTQLAEMNKISKSLKDFIRNDIGAAGFVALGENNFRAVDFCIISALGAAPKGDQLDISVTPKRIFDPILWVMNNSSDPINIIRNFFFKIKTSFSNFIKRAQTSTKKETQAPPPPVIREPINYRNVVKYGAAALVLALVILFLYFPGVFPRFSLPEFNLAQTPATTTSAIAVNAKNLDIRSYGDYLAAGQTNAYYFDIAQNGENIEMIKVFAQAKSGNIITAAVGFNYAPSIENDKYDYLSSTSTTSDYAVIQINNPTPGRYYVMVKGITGSGDTRISRSLFK
jgi:hypothetical protein